MTSGIRLFDEEVPSEAFGIGLLILLGRAGIPTHGQVLATSAGSLCWAGAAESFWHVLLIDASRSVYRPTLECTRGRCEDASRFSIVEADEVEPKVICHCPSASVAAQCFELHDPSLHAEASLGRCLRVKPSPAKPSPM